MQNLSYISERWNDQSYERSEDSSISECECCHGSGKVYVSCCGDPMEPDQTQCPTCKDECGYMGDECGICAGEGVVNND